jgi:hypothetical protein
VDVSTLLWALLILVASQPVVRKRVLEIMRQRRILLIEQKRTGPIA